MGEKFRFSDSRNISSGRDDVEICDPFLENTWSGHLPGVPETLTYALEGKLSFIAVNLINLFFGDTMLAELWLRLFPMRTGDEDW